MLYLKIPQYPGKYRMARRGRKRSPVKLKIRQDIANSLGTLMFFALALLVMYSFSGRSEGLRAISIALRTLFGVASLLLPFMLIAAGLVLTNMKWALARPTVFLGSCVLFLGTLGLTGGGTTGEILFTKLSNVLSPLGAHTVFFIIAIAGIIIMIDSGIGEILHFLASIFEIIPKPVKEPKEEVGTTNSEKKNESQEATMKIKGGNTLNQDVKQEVKLHPERKIDLAIHQKVVQPTGDIQGKHDGKAKTTSPGENLSVWQLPSLSLLDTKTGGQADRGNIKDNA